MRVHGARKKRRRQITGLKCSRAQSGHKWLSAGVLNVKYSGLDSCRSAGRASRLRGPIWLVHHLGRRPPNPRHPPHTSNPFRRPTVARRERDAALKNHDAIAKLHNRIAGRKGRISNFLVPRAANEQLETFACRVTSSRRLVGISLCAYVGPQIDQTGKYQSINLTSQLFEKQQNLLVSKQLLLF